MMIDLSTTYLGISLKNPLVASASVISKKLDNIKKLEDAGVSAVVLYSLFEEQITQESLSLNYFLERGTESYAEAITYFPDMQSYNLEPDKYLDLIQKAKQEMDIPIIGSLNGVSQGGWIKYARMIEEAGADALELNIYYLPTSAYIDATLLEKMYAGLVKKIADSIDIPLAVKLNPFFTSLPSFGKDLVEYGAKGLVLFNRFYQPDLDIENMEVVPALDLSTSKDLRLPLRWIAILYSRIKADLALTSGVHNGVDIVKALMAGASVAMSASELIANGIQRARSMLDELITWMQTHEYETTDQMRGSMSQGNVAEPAAFERANYMKALNLFDADFRY
ncbi:MAG TPA: dihydroorotate dehydrogenase-like protein [Anaerolineaceae bacterium]|nr:dihydroorotate dehydrogenase-like protein [Anaerolineaceae bacterium]